LARLTKKLAENNKCKYPTKFNDVMIHEIVRVHLSVSSQLRGLRVRAQREPVAS